MHQIAQSWRHYFHKISGVDTPERGKLPFQTLPSRRSSTVPLFQRFCGRCMWSTDASLNRHHNCNKSCKEMGGVTSVMPLIMDAFSQQAAATTQWVDTYAVIGCKLHVPA